jgi:hypothetical protein
MAESCLLEHLVFEKVATPVQRRLQLEHLVFKKVATLAQIHCQNKLANAKAFHPRPQNPTSFDQKNE